MKSFPKIRVTTVLLLLAVAAFAQKPAAKPAELLPQSFAGWTLSGSPTHSTDPATMDEAQRAVLAEDGFTSGSQATYTNGDNKLTLRAAQFRDASGAYAAFTFYRKPNMRAETVGTMAVSDNERVLFFRSNILVEARFAQVNAMSAASLRELAAGLPAVSGPLATLPSLPSYVPRDVLVPNTAQYIIGPAAFGASGLQFPAQTVKFDLSPEILTAKLRTDAGVADFLLVSYPTPQIAMERVKTFESSNPQGQNVTYAVKRTGPMVAVVTGAISERDARKVLSGVNYEADVTWNENTGLSKRDNIGSIVVAAVTLAFVIFLMSLGAGAIFGFGRVIMRKILPAKYAPQERQGEIIRLKLGD